MFIKSVFFFGKKYLKNCFQVFKRICKKLGNLAALSASLPVQYSTVAFLATLAQQSL